ncbi:TKL protein kinase [Saprolegnia diclina VS20]|uniref:TKL protein kinase n=1 Tax=Saprolegnia diclina (strain VS20) TaxID=1156394 RepID=T0S7N9_SAPDV|nr:TKL protein kinase [Saprolegnia diclina VS20]EQC41143.1 TKL protein kinase [Saprolegnia diclina VS20]|eukprot:XP_008604857.1 TKL protein kinase [Saprolegnia diclina VS20]
MGTCSSTQTPAYVETPDPAATRSQRSMAEFIQSENNPNRSRAPTSLTKTSFTNSLVHSGSIRFDDVHRDDYKEMLAMYPQFWVVPEDVERTRAIPSNYMKTEMGHCDATAVFLKSLDLKRSPAEIEKSRKALLSEIRSMARIDHPHIVSFIGFNITPEFGLSCIFEFMEGRTLRHLLDNPKQFARLTWSNEKINIACDIASAMAYMHGLKPQLLHRNMKASKVLLTNRKQAKLSGFGSSRDRTFDCDMTTGVTDIQWSAPELFIDGEDYDEKVDVYSFGVLLTELDTGAMPYAVEAAGMTLPDLTVKLVTGELRPSVSVTCPEVVAKIIKQCLQHDKALRPTSDRVLEMLQHARVELKAERDARLGLDALQ